MALPAPTRPGQTRGRSPATLALARTVRARRAEGWSFPGIARELNLPIQRVRHLFYRVPDGEIEPVPAARQEVIRQAAACGIRVHDLACKYSISTATVRAILARTCPEAPGAPSLHPLAGSVKPERQRAHGGGRG